MAYKCIKCFDCSSWKRAVGLEPNDLICLYTTESFMTHVCCGGALSYKNHRPEHLKKKLQAFQCITCKTHWLAPEEMQEHINVNHVSVDEDYASTDALEDPDNDSCRTGDGSDNDDITHQEDMLVEQCGGWMHTTLFMSTEHTVITFTGSQNYCRNYDFRPLGLLGRPTLPVAFTHPDNDYIFPVRRIALVAKYHSPEASTLFAPIKLAARAHTVINTKITGFRAIDMSPPSEHFAEQAAESQAKAFPLYTPTFPTITITDTLPAVDIVQDAANAITIPRKLGSTEYLTSCTLYCYVDRENTFYDRLNVLPSMPTTIYRAFWEHVSVDDIAAEGVMIRTELAQLNTTPKTISCQLQVGNDIKVWARAFGCVLTYRKMVQDNMAHYLRLPVRFRPMYGPTHYKHLVNATLNAIQSVQGESLAFNSMLSLTWLPRNIKELQLSTSILPAACNDLTAFQVSVTQTSQTLLCECPPEISMPGHTYTLVSADYYIVYNLFTASLQIIPDQHRLASVLARELTLTDRHASTTVEKPKPLLEIPTVIAQHCGSGFDRLDYRSRTEQLWLTFEIATGLDELKIVLEKRRSQYYDGEFPIDAVRTTKGTTLYPPTQLFTSRGNIYEAELFAGVVRYANETMFLPTLVTPVNETLTTVSHVREIMPKDNSVEAMAEAVRHAARIDVNQPFRLHIYNPRTQTKGGRIGIESVQRPNSIEHFVPISFKPAFTEDYNQNAEHVEIRIGYKLKPTTFEADHIFKGLPLPPIYSGYNIYGNAMTRLSENSFKVNAFEGNGPLPTLHNPYKWAIYGLPVTGEDCKITVADLPMPTEQSATKFRIPFKLGTLPAREWVALAHYGNDNTDSLWMVITAPELNCMLKTTLFTCRGDYVSDFERASTFAQYCACEFQESTNQLELQLKGAQEHDTRMITCTARNIEYMVIPRWLVELPGNKLRTCRTLFLMIRYDRAILPAQEEATNDENHVKIDFPVSLIPAMFNIYGISAESDLHLVTVSGLKMRGHTPDAHWLSVRIQYGTNTFMVLMADADEESELEHLLCLDELAARELALANPLLVSRTDIGRICIKQMAILTKMGIACTEPQKVSRVRDRKIYDLFVPANVNGEQIQKVTCWLQFHTPHL